MRVTLGEVCTVRSSLVDPTRLEFSGLPHIAPDSIEKTSGRLLPYRTVGEDGVTSGKYRFQPGDVLYSKIRPSLNKVALVDFAGLCSADMYALDVNREHATPEYIAHLLRGQEFLDYATSLSNRANIPKLNRGQLLSYGVRLPSLPEQRRIAAVLNHADIFRTKRRQVLSYLQTLPVAIYQLMFGDPAANPHRYAVASIRSLATKFSDGPFGSNLKSSHYTSEGIPVVRLQNIGVGCYLSADRAFVSETHYASLAKHDCQPGDVLIGTLGAPNLRACLQPADMPIALNKADCIQFRVDDSKANATWACWLLNMPGTLTLASAFAHGQTRTRIAMGQLRELEVPVPPLDLQRKFAERIEGVNTQRAALQRALAVDEEIFASLQERAFREEL